MKKIIILFLVKTIGISFSSIHAQPTFTGWMASFNTIKAGKKTSIHTDIQLRSTDEIKQIQTFLVRSGINFHLNKTVIFTTGYAFISNKRVVNAAYGFAPEHRLWEQLLISHKWKTFLVIHRFRLEQRFISKSIVVNNELKTDGYLYSNRFRYFFRSILPFQHQSSFKKGLFGALQNEVFLNFANTTINNEFFDQNRFYLAVGYRLDPRFDLEAGYMNQYVNGTNKSFTNNHIIQLAGYMRL